MQSINKTILIEIQQKREVMIDLVNKKGISNDDTIKCSQELDQLIYQYQYFFRKKRMQRGEQSNQRNPVFICNRLNNLPSVMKAKDEFIISTYPRKHLTDSTETSNPSNIQMLPVKKVEIPI